LYSSLNHITNSLFPNDQFIGDELKTLTMRTQGGGIEVVHVKVGEGSTPLSVV